MRRISYVNSCFAVPLFIVSLSVMFMQQPIASFLMAPLSAICVGLMVTIVALQVWRRRLQAEEEITEDARHALGM